MSMVSREVIAALAEARRSLPRETWQQLVAEFAGAPDRPTPATIRQATANLHNRDAAWMLSEAFEQGTTVRWSDLAAAMSAVDYFVGDGGDLTEIIWTGPANGRFPVRRIDQVLYDLISTARKRVVLVTFAAHRVRHLCTLLTGAVERGVALTLIVESEEESEGQLTTDAAAAFREVPLGPARIYYWPLAHRARNQAGRPGKLHAKCAIVDDVAIIGSANLTDDAFNRNMEIGTLVRDSATVATIDQHFEELIRRGVLLEVSRPRLRAGGSVA